MKGWIADDCCQFNSNLKIQIDEAVFQMSKAVEMCDYLATRTVVRLGLMPSEWNPNLCTSTYNPDSKKVVMLCKIITGIVQNENIMQWFANVLSGITGVECTFVLAYPQYAVKCSK